MNTNKGVRGFIVDNMPREWDIILRRHRVFEKTVDMIYLHNIHISRRRVEWMSENISKLRRIINGSFTNSFDITKAVNTYPEYNYDFWSNINFEINQLKESYR